MCWSVQRITNAALLALSKTGSIKCAYITNTYTTRRMEREGTVRRERGEGDEVRPPPLLPHGVRWAQGRVFDEASLLCACVCVGTGQPSLSSSPSHLFLSPSCCACVCVCFLELSLRARTPGEGVTTVVLSLSNQDAFSCPRRLHALLGGYGCCRSLVDSIRVTLAYRLLPEYLTAAASPESTLCQHPVYG